MLEQERAFAVIPEKDGFNRNARYRIEPTSGGGIRFRLPPVPGRSTIQSFARQAERIDE